MRLPHRYALWDEHPSDRSHSRLDFHGTFSRWSNSDNEATYRTKVVPNNLSKYREEDFGYTHNGAGYRCDEFSTLETSTKFRKNILFLGDSITYGVGIPLEEVWAYRIIQRMRKECPMHSLPYINLAKGGKSMDYCVRMAYNFSQYYPIDQIVVLAPHPARCELMFEGTGPYEFIPGLSLPNSSPLAVEKSRMWDEEFGKNEYIIAYNQNKNFAFLETLAKQLRASLLVASWVNVDNWKSFLEKRFHKYLFETQFICAPTKPNEYARDGMHPSGIRHEEFAAALLDHPPLWNSLDVY